MCFLRKFFCVTLSICLCFLSFVAKADEMPEGALDDRIVTEYNSFDLTDPPIGAIETIGGIGSNIEILGKSAVLMDVDTGTVLYEKEAHLKLPPASITKIMSLLLVVEAIESGQLTLETNLSASAHACSMGGSQIWLEPNEQMTVHELLKASVIGSANDATVVLGEAVAGSEEGFVEMMNQRATQLGMEDTHFVNCTGLDADGHLTSAYDVAVMSKELIKHDLIKNYSTVWMDSLRNGESELVNTNKLVKFYEGCTGLKTGTTSSAGCCLSATAEREGLRLVSVVMGADTSNDRFNSARKLLDYGFANWAKITVTTDPEELHPVKVKGGVFESVDSICTERKSFLVEKQKVKTLLLETEITETLKAPVIKGQQVGATRVYIDGREIGIVKVVAEETVDKMTFIKYIGLLLNSLV